MLYNPIHVHQTATSVAKQIAERIFQQHKIYLKHNKKLHVALSGGSTPKILFDLLSREYAQKIDWKYIHLYWVDERCVPPTDEQSNYKMTYETLLSKVPIPTQNIHPMQGNRPPKEETLRYIQLLKDNLPQQDGYPQFDILLLGMGADGHTASIFPNQSELLHTNQTVSIAQHPITAQQRITLTGNTILRANSILFLITGQDKAKRLSEIINETNAYSDYPTHYILKQSTAEIFADKEATALL